MATTTNYGWTTPDDTALVKDGAAAIRSLGSSIDTSLNTALGTKKAGMVLLNTTSFSGVASQAFPNNTFSATYDHYMILIYLTSFTATGNFGFRLRSSGSDYSGAVHNRMAVSQATSGGPGGYVGTGETQVFLGGSHNSAPGASTQLFLYNPFATKEKHVTFQTATRDGGGTYTSYQGGIQIGSALSYDSINIFNSSGNITGQISCYGINK